MDNSDKRYNLAEFEAYIPDKYSWEFELFDGKIIKKSPSINHDRTISTIYSELQRWRHFSADDIQKLTGYSSTRASYRLNDDNYNNLRPDISFFHTDEKVKSSEAVLYKFPDFVVEVESSRHTQAILREKALFYIKQGVHLVWLVYPNQRLVEVYHEDSSREIFHDGHILDGGEVLPNLSLYVIDIFESHHARYMGLKFEWKIIDKIDYTSLDEMREAFLKPQTVPPEAWFMNGMNYLEEFDNYETMSKNKLSFSLSDFAGGITSFGRLKIWVDWFLHILPYMLETDTSYYFETIIEFFFAMYPDEIFEEYFGFRHTIFNTLMNEIMLADYWEDSDLRIPDWIEENKKHLYLDEGYLGISLEFCVKYLFGKDLIIWLDSVAEIDAPLWNDQTHFWFKSFITHPDEYHIGEQKTDILSKVLKKYPKYADI